MAEQQFLDDLRRARPDLERLNSDLIEIGDSLFSRTVAAHLEIAHAHVKLALLALSEDEERAAFRAAHARAGP